jgi:hypothetical protein
VSFGGVGHPVVVGLGSWLGDWVGGSLGGWGVGGGRISVWSSDSCVGEETRFLLPSRLLGIWERLLRDEKKPSGRLGHQLPFRLGKLG